MKISQFLLALLALGLTASAGYKRGQKVVAAYYPDYEISLLAAADVNYDLYSHINYFVAVQRNPSPSSPLIVSNETNMRTLIEIAHRHKVSVSITVGGWTGSRFFSEQVSTPANRTALVATLTSFMKQWGFDGIDLDWEYPNRQGMGCNSINPNDTANFLLMLQELRKVVGPNKILSAAVPVEGLNGPNGAIVQNLSGFAQVLDYVTVMVYDIMP